MLRSCPAPGRLAGLVTGAALLAAMMIGSARADDGHVTVRAELGVEYDSNVHRAEEIAGAATPPIVGSPLARAVFGWSATDRLGNIQDVAFTVLGAAKAFSAPAARNENVSVVETSGLWRLEVGATTRLGLAAAYYEAIQAGSPAERELSTLDLKGDPRDFRSLTPTLRVQQVIANAATLALGMGYRWFTFKPNRDYDFRAPVFGLEYRLSHETADGGVEWDIVVGGGLELRRFGGPRLVPLPAGCASPGCVPTPDPTGAPHDDQFYLGHLEITRTGVVLVGAGYAIQWNRSNSYGESVLYHVGTVRFTAPLPFGIYLAARTELVYAAYADPVAQSINPASGRPNATIEDENRSQIRAELSHDIAAHLQLVGRYSLYVNALNQRATTAQDLTGSTTSVPDHGRYLRQTATLSLVYSID